MITIVINGQNYDYPQVGDTEWGDAATTAMQALASVTLQPVKDVNDPTVVNNFTLYNDINFGNTNGLRVLFVESNSNNPALSGVFRLCNSELIAWRNEDNDGDNTISFDSDGDLIVNGTKVTLHGQIVNDDIAAAAGIEESKLALDHSTQSLYDNIENHKSDTANPHLTNLVNLVDTTIVTPSDNDTLLYDGNDSKWKNIPNTVSNVKDVTISSIADGDVLVYDSNDSDWKNSDVVSSHVSNTSNPHSVTKSQILTGDLIVNADVDASAAIAESKLSLDYSTSSLNTAITSHTGNTSNPHSTSVSNLTDTTITSVGSGDVLTYDGSKWINAPSSSASLSGLSDTDITTPSDGDVLVYDSVSTKWENSDQLSTLDSTVSTHVADTANPHSTSVSNLTDTTITTPSDQDTVVYDNLSSKWINQANTLDNLKNTTITTPGSGDTLSYNGSVWVNKEDSLANLTDTTITTPSDQDALIYDGNSSEWINQANTINNISNVSIDSNTLAVGDALVFDDQDSLWKNNASFTNHIGNAANPHLTTVAKLTDTTITTPANNDVLLYDYANSQWINSPVIEVYDIANINTAVTDVTLTASDKRHQIFTATNGFNITLPSTGIKAGESFLFGYSNSWWSTFTNQFNFNAADNTLVFADFTEFWDTRVIALVDNPATSTDWGIERILSRPFVISGKKTSISFTFNSSGIAEPTSGLIGYLPRCVMEFSYHIDLGMTTPSYGYQQMIFRRAATTDATYNLVYLDNEIVGTRYVYNIPLSATSASAGAITKSGTLKLDTTGVLQFPVYCYMHLQGAANSSDTVNVRYAASMVAPL